MTYDNTASASGTVGVWGPAVTQTYGETLLPPTGNTVLQNFTFYVDGSGTTEVTRAYVYAWDGSKATGPALFSSAAPFTINADQAYTVNTGNTRLTASQEYVLFFSVTQDAALSSGKANWNTSTTAGGSGGQFVYFNNTTTAQFTSTAWDGADGYNGDFLEFKALFAKTGTGLPEPGALAFALLGALPLLAAMRQRQKPSRPV